MILITNLKTKCKIIPYFNYSKKKITSMNLYCTTQLREKLVQILSTNKVVVVTKLVILIALI